MVAAGAGFDVTGVAVTGETGFMVFAATGAGATAGGVSSTIVTCIDRKSASFNSYTLLKSVAISLPIICEDTPYRINVRDMSTVIARDFSSSSFFSVSKMLWTPSLSASDKSLLSRRKQHKTGGHTLVL